MFPDLPTDDSEYEKKIIQHVIKAAIAKKLRAKDDGLLGKTFFLCYKLICY
jgi:hypothetical protein